MEHPGVEREPGPVIAVIAVDFFVKTSEQMAIPGIRGSLDFKANIKC